MKKQHTFRPQGLDGLEVRLAPSSMNPGAFLAALIANINAKVHHGGHHGGGHRGHGGSSNDGESSKK
jgi:hypothetical protein